MNERELAQERGRTLALLESIERTLDTAWALCKGARERYGSSDLVGASLAHLRVNIEEAQSRTHYTTSLHRKDML